VDEYQSDITICRKTSRRTLMLREVIEVLDSAGGDLDTQGAGIVVAWWNQQWEYGDHPQACTDFASVESEIYAELPAWYDQQAAQWRAAHQRPTPWAQHIGVSLAAPEGWRPVSEPEWRRSKADLEARGHVSKDSLTYPDAILSKSPEGFEGEAPEIQVFVSLPGPDQEPRDSKEVTLAALDWISRAYDRTKVLEEIQPVWFQGFPGHCVAVAFTEPRPGRPPRHWAGRLFNVEVAESLIQVWTLVPLYDPEPETWNELHQLYESIQIHAGPARASEVP
jgi:hypothetical protein